MTTLARTNKAGEKSSLNPQAKNALGAGNGGASSDRATEHIGETEMTITADSRRQSAERNTGVAQQYYVEGTEEAMAPSIVEENRREKSTHSCFDQLRFSTSY